LPTDYLHELTAELEKRKIPFRNEHELQDLTAEPLAQFIINFLLVIFGDRQPEAFHKLTGRLAAFELEDVSESNETQWLSYISEQRAEAFHSKAKDRTLPFVWSFVEGFLLKVTAERLVALSTDYEDNSRFTQILEETKKRLGERLNPTTDIEEVLNLLCDEGAVRLLTIHKSKGLEFDSVVMLGIENEVFWGNNKGELRCGFFVGISRAKKRLVLTHVDSRPRPPTRVGVWKVARTPHEEFLGYARPYVTN